MKLQQDYPVKILLLRKINERETKMSDIMYNCSEAGKEIKDSRGKNIMIRKYHLSPKEMEANRSKWLADISSVDVALKNKAGTVFFNPYRKGIYYYQVQSLFLLGANEWHDLSIILNKLEEYSSTILLTSQQRKTYGYRTAWDQFIGKSSRINAEKCKDYIGRIQENFILLQRLSKLHPYGYKLHQVCAAIDIKRVSRSGFPNGVYYYRLSTYDSENKAYPIRDFKEFNFPKHESKYINYRFLGKIVTKDKVLIDGKAV